MQGDHADNPRDRLSPRDRTKKLRILPYGLLMGRTDLGPVVHPVLLLLSGFGSVCASGRRGAGCGIVDLAFGGVFEG
jgi:hypothetical protein